MASKNVVLVHGGFVDGSGWQGVYSILSKDGYTVSIVQNPTLSLAGDVEATKRVIDAQGEPVKLEFEPPSSRVVQHELDHLDGVLIIDRTDEQSRRAALATLRPQPVLGAR